MQCHEAYPSTQENDQPQVDHLFLNQSYSILFCAKNESDYLSPDDLIRLREVEKQWFDKGYQQCLARFQCDKDVTSVAVVESAIKQHSVYNHKIFNYFYDKATINDLREFILDGSVLILSFSDYLSTCAIGVSDIARSEVMENLWDEAGHGDVEKFHTSTFKKLMLALGLEYDRNRIIQNMSWQALAGINLFAYFSYYPFNKMKMIGLLAATELLDSLHYPQLNKGINRILTQNNIDYKEYAGHYVLHETVDISHAEHWVEKVVIQELTINPGAIQDFWLGFYMRLDSLETYYDSLLNRFLINSSL